MLPQLSCIHLFSGGMLCNRICFSDACELAVVSQSCDNDTWFPGIRGLGSRLGFRHVCFILVYYINVILTEETLVHIIIFNIFYSSKASSLSDASDRRKGDLSAFNHCIVLVSHVVPYHTQGASIGGWSAVVFL